MTKVRTVVPANATPGRSLLQVVNPKTGKSVRVRVPEDAVPGAMIELSLPDEAELKLPPKSATPIDQTDNANLKNESSIHAVASSPKEDAGTVEAGVESVKPSVTKSVRSQGLVEQGISDKKTTVNEYSNPAVSEALLPVASIPPPTQAPIQSLFTNNDTTSPLLKDDEKPKPQTGPNKSQGKNDGCMSCLTNPGAFLKSLCA